MIVGDLDRAVVAYRLLLVVTDGLGPIVRHGEGLVVADALLLIVANLQGAIVADAQRLVVADGLVLVVLDGYRPVLLTVEIDLFVPRFVLETKLVGASAARR